MNTFQKYIFSVLENKSKTAWGKFWERLLFFFIFASVFFATLETIPELAEYASLFWLFEIVSIGIFTVEYGLRLWTASLKKGYEGPWGWLRYAMTPLMIFDLLVLLPFYLLLLPPSLFDPRFLRIFRLFRILRIFRIGRYSIAVDRILSVLRREKEELVAISMIMLILMLLSSTLVYLAEESVVGTDFTSIPATFWWAIATLTTIGYGDMVPVTSIGQILAGITAFIGVGIFALSTGLLGASFYQEVQKNREKTMKKVARELTEIKSLTEEHGEEVDLFIKRQQRRIRELEKKMEEMQQYGEKKGLDLINMKKNPKKKLKSIKDSLIFWKR